MPSLQSSIIRCLLRLRKATFQSDAPIEKLRFTARRGQSFLRLPRGVEVHSVIVDCVPAEWIVPLGAESPSVILYIHGGGWTMGWYGLHRRLVAHICRAAGTRALAPDYRLAPEHPFPAAMEDCAISYRWLLRNGTLPQHIVIAGDSAGANLGLVTLMLLRDEGHKLPAAAVWISPITDLEGRDRVPQDHRRQVSGCPCPIARHSPGRGRSDRSRSGADAARVRRGCKPAQWIASVRRRRHHQSVWSDGSTSLGRGYQMCL
jgi:acetyl esterase/lipase